MHIVSYSKYTGWPCAINIGQKDLKTWTAKLSPSNRNVKWASTRLLEDFWVARTHHAQSLQKQLWPTLLGTDVEVQNQMFLPQSRGHHQCIGGKFVVLRKSARPTIPSQTFLPLWHTPKSINWYQPYSIPWLNLKWIFWSINPLRSTTDLF